MLWARLDTIEFSQRYGTYLLALQGAVAASAGQLQAGPAVSNSAGRAAALQIHATFLPSLQQAGRELVVNAATLGAVAAGSQADPAIYESRADELNRLLQQLVAADALQAVSIIKQQAMRYQLARARSPHTVALLQALGELGKDPFSQLDRANRRFQSEKLALGHAKQVAASTYASAFVSAALAAGHQVAQLVHPERPQLVRLDDPALQLEFHPNTRATLALPESA